MRKVVSAIETHMLEYIPHTLLYFHFTNAELQYHEVFESAKCDTEMCINSDTQIEVSTGNTGP